MDIRPLQSGDTMALREFFDRIPDGDRTFFKEDVSDPETVAAWAHGGRDQRWLAVDGGTIVGYVAVVPGVGWSSHVGELRVVVDHMGQVDELAVDLAAKRGLGQAGADAGGDIADRQRRRVLTARAVGELNGNHGVLRFGVHQ